LGVSLHLLVDERDDVLIARAQPGADLAEQLLRALLLELGERAVLGAQQKIDDAIELAVEQLVDHAHDRSLVARTVDEELQLAATRVVWRKCDHDFGLRRRAIDTPLNGPGVDLCATMAPRARSTFT
jgi:hypothetical protein